MRRGEMEGVRYIISKRGTEHVLFEGNTYTPNEKSFEGRSMRTWKCSMYYKYKCRARVTTRHFGDKQYIKASSVDHTHAKIFPDDPILPSQHLADKVQLKARNPIHY